MDKRSNTKNLIWNFIGTTINACMSLVYQIIVTRINGVEASGVFTVCFSFSLIIQTVANLGGRVFEVADRDGNDNTYYTLKWIMGAVSLLIAFIFATVNGYERDKCILVILLMLVRITECFSDTIYSVLQKAERLDLIGISYVLKNVTAIGCFAIVDVFTGNLILSVCTMLLATTVVYICYDKGVCARFHKLRRNSSLKECAMLVRRIYGFLGYNLLIMVIANMPKMIADLKYSDSQMGYLGILMMIPTVMLLMGQIIVQQYLTRITIHYRTGNYHAVNEVLRNVFMAIMILTVLCCALAYYLGAPALQIVYGLEFAEYRPVMILAVLAGMFNVFVTVLSAILTVMEKSRQQMYLYAIVAVMEAGILSLGISAQVFSSAFVAYLLIMALQLVAFAVYFVHSIKEKKYGK